MRGRRMHPLEQKILRSDRVLRCYLALIAPSGKSRFVLWLVILPLALFAVFCKITHQEARFDFGSLDLPVAPGSHDVFVGLSFLGDSMVWPYFLLVPLLLVMLRVAIGKTVVLREKCGEL